MNHHSPEKYIQHHPHYGYQARPLPGYEVDSGMRRSMCTYHSTFTPCSLDAFGPTNELRELYKQQSRGAGAGCPLGCRF